MSKNWSAGDHPAIEARGLVKVYGETRALDGIDLTVRRGHRQQSRHRRADAGHVRQQHLRPACHDARLAKAFVNVNPVSHVADASRVLMNNTSGGGGAVAWSLIATACITLVFAPLTLHLYGKQAGPAQGASPAAKSST